MGRTIEDAADELEAFACRNHAREEAERAATRELVSHLPRQTPAAGSPATEAGANPSANTAVPAPANMQQAPAEGQTVDKAPTNELRGQLMTEEDRTARVQESEQPLLPVLSGRDLLLPALLFLFLTSGWRWSELRHERR
jgi:cobaltochelatase CobN